MMVGKDISIPWKFSRYLFREVVYIVSLSIGILTFVFVLASLGKIADFIVNKGVGLKDIILLVLLYIPPYFTFTLPMAFLLGTVIVLGRFSAENEILALKTNGVNLKWLYLPVTFLGIVIMLLMLFNSNILMPRCSKFLKDTLISIVKNGISIDDKEGVFNDSIPGIVVYIQKKDLNRSGLSGIFISDEHDPNTKQTITANKGLVDINPDTFHLYFVLKEGSIHQWDRKTDTYRNITFDNYTFTLNLTPLLSHAGITRKMPQQKSPEEIRCLLAKTTDKDERYNLLSEFYRNISFHFSILTFVLISVPLGARRKSGGKSSAIFCSLGVFVLYYVLMASANGFGRSLHIPPLMTAFIPNIVIMIIGLYFLSNLNKEESNTGILEFVGYLGLYCRAKYNSLMKITN